MFARTPRLLLRPGWREDAPALAAAIGDEAIVRNLATAPWPYSVDDAEAFLAREQDPRHPALLIFARTRGAPRLIGGIGIAPAAEGGRELGYWIARRYWGLGFATEAGRALLAAAADTLRLTPLSASHFRDNPASGRVLAKLGFVPTGETVQRFSAGRGAMVDAAVYRQQAQLRPDRAVRADAPALCLEAA
jgi:RimJ/RimL family protein N-acetyltransferase